MAVGTVKLTIVDWAQRLDPDGATADVAEVLNENNPIINDMIFAVSNLPTGHRLTVRAGLPEPAWRLINHGVKRSKSRTVQVTETMGMLEAYAEIDKSLADLNGNATAFRLSEDKAFIEQMKQEMASTLFYGNTGTDPEKFLGLTPRYSSLAAQNGINVLDAGGKGDTNTSLWLVTWDPSTCFGIFPKGSKAGLVLEDQGQVTLQDEDHDPYEGYRTHYKWDVGLALKDWRYVVRIANIDTAALTVDAKTGAKLINLMIAAYYRIPSQRRGRKAFYCNTMIAQYLHFQAMNGENVNLTLDEVAGEPITRLLNIPVRVCDSLVNTEQAVLN